MILGIDLGTTNTSAAVIKNGKPVFVCTGYSKNDFLLPSVAALTEKGKLIVGEKAKDMHSLKPESVIKSVKSLIGTNREVILVNPRTRSKDLFSPIEISSKILAEIKTLAEKQFKTKIQKAVITVPAYFNDKARKDTIQAGEMAGLDVVRIINEPTAAALSYGVQNRKLKNSYIMVYDLGGGTFDISIIEINGEVIEVIASDGDRNLGGDNFDYSLFSYLFAVMEKNKKADLRSMCTMAALLNESEETKNKLSSLIKYKICMPKHKFEQTVYREDLEKLIEPLLNKTLNHCKSVIARSTLKNKDIDKILLVGGSSRIPAVKEMLENELKIPVSQEIDPDLAVVTGAAIQAAIIEGNKVDSVLLDVAPHSLSIGCVFEKNGKKIPNYCSKIIKKNTPVPCTVEEIFSTLKDDQDSVRIAVYQGESDFEDENTLIKELKFDGLKAKKAGEAEILVSFSYSLDGTINIKATEEGTKNKTSQKVELLDKNRKRSSTKEATLH
ncbi:MAG: Hsp70 family protein [Pseudomonadota bacterium]